MRTQRKEWPGGNIIYGIASLLAVLVGFVASAMSLSSSLVQLWSDEEFPIRLVETTVDFSQGVESSACVVIQSDGRFHLEIRSHRLSQHAVSLKVYESSVDTTQMQHLRDALSRARIEMLPPFARPRLPLNVASFQTMVATITRREKHLQAGYLTWEGGVPDAPPNASPDDLKRAWRDSRIALAPVAEWFHQLVTTTTMRMQPSRDTRATACGDLLEY